jgi:hypothetical protein
MIADEVELNNTRRKLELLRQAYDAESQTSPSRARDLTLQSLSRLIGQLTEEIAWMEHGGRAARPAAS